MKVPELWNLDTFGITDPNQTFSKAEEEQLTHDIFYKRSYQI